MTRMRLTGPALAAAGLLLAATWQTPVRAQQGAAGAAIEKEAIAALEKMGSYLRSLKAFQVVAQTSTEEVLEDGQKVQFTGEVNAMAQMPNRLRMTTASDRRERLYVYDGKQFTLYARRVDFYATVAAPATIGALADVLDQKYNINLPLEDLFRWGGSQSPTAGITSAMYIGPSTINGVTCGHYIFRQAGLDWQVWIQLGEYPLPRKLVLTTTSDEARPQYTATMDWNLAPSYNDEAFTFVAPKSAGRVVLAEVK
jgi:hypothetical protein